MHVMSNSTILRKITNPLILLIGVVLSLNKSYAQTSSGFSYLVSCFKNSSIDSFEVQIDGIGAVMTHNLTSDNVKTEAILTYYDIPVNKRSKSTKKLAGLAANRQIETWKNNSKLLHYKESKNASSIIIDVRLHIIIEDIYLQVLVILENDRVFEIDHFQDKNDPVNFDRLTEQIKNKNCP